MNHPRLLISVALALGVISALADVDPAKLPAASAQKDITYAKDLIDAEEQIRARAHECDVIMVIGAGDADQLARKLIL